MMNAIEIRNLTKTFGQKVAVDNLSMTVPEGAIYGFIGENGSGKSTTEKMICGLLHSKSGSITLLNKDVKDEEARSQVGCLIEMPGCFPNLSVYDNMVLQAINLGIKNKEERIHKTLRMVHMDGSASNKFKNCSLGMKQRIGIAFALLGNPKILILDEPINGLDVDGMRIMREILAEVSKNGTTVLISSHILGELEKIATHYGIIRNGKMIAEMSREELEKNCRTYINVSTNEDKAYNILKAKYDVKKDEDGFLRIYDNASINDVINFLLKENISFDEVTTKKISLEEYYIDLMKEDR